MWFKNAQLFQFTEPFTLSENDFLKNLEERQFNELPSGEMRAMGWSAPGIDPEGPLLYSANGFWLLCLTHEERIIPSSVVNKLVQEKLAELEKSLGRAPRKAEKQRVKEEVFHSLLPRAFTKITKTYGYIDPQAGLLIVDAATPSRAEDWTIFLRKTLGSLKIQLPKIHHIPTLLTQWLTDNRYPAEFTIQDTCVLRDKEEGGLIRCQKQNLLSHEILGLIRSGRQVVQLKVSWCDQLNFILKEDLSICALRPLESLQESTNDIDANDKAAQFDADFCLMTETLRYFWEQILKVFTH